MCIVTFRVINEITAYHRRYFIVNLSWLSGVADKRFFAFTLTIKSSKIAFVFTRQQCRSKCILLNN